MSDAFKRGVPGREGVREFQVEYGMRKIRVAY